MNLSGLIMSYATSSSVYRGHFCKLSTTLGARRSFISNSLINSSTFSYFVSSFAMRKSAAMELRNTKYDEERSPPHLERACFNTEQERYADHLLREFAGRTGLTDASQSQKRYLWTDSFAIFAYLGLFQRTKNIIYLDNARTLVKQVHEVLGKHRSDDVRFGWISGLSDEEAKIHPTIGGLRIGKETNERKPNEPFIERNEWHQDGQYFHYLTKWMRALEAVACITGKDGYLEWSIELAKKAHSAFLYDYGPHHGDKRMYWKMSIDLSRPLVEYMGKHDPLDGYVTMKLLKASSRNRPTRLHALERELKDFTNMVAPTRNFDTTDPLGIGGILLDIYTLIQVLVLENAFHEQNKVLKHIVRRLLQSAEASLSLFASIGEISYEADSRLPFRELGLSIGLHSLEKLKEMDKEEWGDDDFRLEVEGALTGLSRYFKIAKNIEDFWMEERNQSSITWTEHIDINSVMLAVSLVPDGCLNISSS